MIDARVKNYSVAVLCVVLAVVIANVGWNVRLSLREGREIVRETGANVVGATSELAEWAEFQNEDFRNPKRRKAIDAAFELPAVLNGSVRQWNTIGAPKLYATISALETFVRNLDTNVNVELLPEIAKTARALNTSVSTVNDILADVRSELRRMVTEGLLTAEDARKILADIHKIMSDDKWVDTLKEVNEGVKKSNSILGHGDEVIAQVAEASKKAPTIAASLDKIARTSSRFSKITILANIFSTLMKVF